MPAKASVDEMIDVVLDADRPLTEADIGERVGVTRRTVSNHREELQNHPAIEYGKVGRATAYWVADESAEPPDMGGGVAPGETMDGSEESNDGLLERLKRLTTSEDDRMAMPGVYILLVAFTAAPVFIGILFIALGSWVLRPFSELYDAIQADEPLGATFYATFFAVIGGEFVALGAVAMALGLHRTALLASASGVALAGIGAFALLGAAFVWAIATAAAWSIADRVSQRGAPA